MKNTFMLGLVAGTILLASCGKNDPEPTNPGNTSPIVVKYEFNSNVAANYRLAYQKDTVVVDEFINTASWTKTVSVARNSQNKLARLSVYPPVEWIGTGNTANVNIKLSIDGVVRKDTSGILADFDRPTGLTVSLNY